MMRQRSHQGLILGRLLLAAIALLSSTPTAHGFSVKQHATTPPSGLFQRQERRQSPRKLYPSAIAAALDFDLQLQRTPRPADMIHIAKAVELQPRRRYYWRKPLNLRKRLLRRVASLVMVLAVMFFSLSPASMDFSTTGPTTTSEIVTTLSKSRGYAAHLGTASGGGSTSSSLGISDRRLAAILPRSRTGAASTTATSSTSSTERSNSDGQTASSSLQFVSGATAVLVSAGAGVAIATKSIPEREERDEEEDGIIGDDMDDLFLDELDEPYELASSSSTLFEDSAEEQADAFDNDDYEYETLAPRRTISQEHFSAFEEVSNKSPTTTKMDPFLEKSLEEATRDLMDYRTNYRPRRVENDDDDESEEDEQFVDNTVVRRSSSMETNRTDPFLERSLEESLAALNEDDDYHHAQEDETPGRIPDFMDKRVFPTIQLSSSKATKEMQEMKVLNNKKQKSKSSEVAISRENEDEESDDEAEEEAPDRPRTFEEIQLEQQRAYVERIINRTTNVLPATKSRRNKQEQQEQPSSSPVAVKRATGLIRSSPARGDSNQSALSEFTDEAWVARHLPITTPPRKKTNATSSYAQTLSSRSPQKTATTLGMLPVDEYTVWEERHMATRYSSLPPEERTLRVLIDLGMVEVTGGLG